MTPEQLRMARALLRMKTSDLAEQSGVNKMTISGLEAGKKAPHAQTVRRLTEFLQSKGVIFIGAHEPIHGPTVALRHGMEPPAIEGENASAGEDADDGGLQATAWDDDEDLAILARRDVDDLRRYWAEGGRWARLSEPSRKALRRAMGQAPMTA